MPSDEVSLASEQPMSLLASARPQPSSALPCCRFARQQTTRDLMVGGVVAFGKAVERLPQEPAHLIALGGVAREAAHTRHGLQLPRFRPLPPCNCQRALETLAGPLERSRSGRRNQ